jgi:hypothetical protein
VLGHVYPSTQPLSGHQLYPRHVTFSPNHLFPLPASFRCFLLLSPTTYLWPTHHFSRVLCPPHPYSHLPHVPISALPALFRAITSYPCFVFHWFTLFCERVSGNGRNWRAVLRFCPVFLYKPEISAGGLLCILPTSCWFLALHILRPWRWRRHVLLKRRLTLNGLHGVTVQKTELSTRKPDYHTRIATGEASYAKGNTWATLNRTMKARNWSVPLYLS